MCIASRARSAPTRAHRASLLTRHGQHAGAPIHPNASAGRRVIRLCRPDCYANSSMQLPRAQRSPDGFVCCTDRSLLRGQPHDREAQRAPPNQMPAQAGILFHRRSLPIGPERTRGEHEPSIAWLVSQDGSRANVTNLHHRLAGRRTYGVSVRCAHLICTMRARDRSGI